MVLFFFTDMKQCYTSQRCANRGPHKVNSRSYVGSVLRSDFVPPKPFIAPSPVPSVSVSLPWYVRFLNWFKSLFKSLFNF